MSLLNVYTEEEAGTKTLIPGGTLVRLKIETDGVAKERDGKTSIMWKLTVKEGPYAGAELYDFLSIKGQKEYAITRGKNAMMYALDINRGAHLKLPDQSGYAIQSYKEFNGMEVVAKIKVEADSLKTDSGEMKYFHKNNIETYCTLRPDSSTYKYFGAYQAGDQRWVTDALPPLGGSNGRSNAGYQPSSGNDSYNHAMDDIPL